MPTLPRDRPQFHGIYVTKLPERHAYEVLALSEMGQMLIGECAAQRTGSVDWSQRTNQIFSKPRSSTNWTFEGGFLRFIVPHPKGICSCLGTINRSRLEVSVFSHITGANYFKKYEFVPLIENLAPLFANGHSMVPLPAGEARPHIDGQPVWPPPFPLLGYLKGRKTVRLAVEWGYEERAIRIGEYEWITIAQGMPWSIDGGAYSDEGVRYKPTWRFNYKSPGSLLVSYSSVSEGEGDGFDGAIVDALSDTPE